MTEMQDKEHILPPRLRLDHVGVAVPKIEAAIEFYAKAVGYRVVSGPFDDERQQARVVFLACDGPVQFEVELIAPLSEKSHVHRLLDRGVGAYHLCYETSDIYESVKNLAACGCLVVSNPVPATAYAGRKIAWLYTPAKQLMELVEAPGIDDCQDAECGLP